MGMYTELVLKCSLKEDVPDDVVTVVSYLFCNGTDEPKQLPDHKFFSLSRWQHIGKSCSFYHHPEIINSCPVYDYTDSRYIFSRSDIKNYDGEIEAFIDWFKPYVDAEEGQCIGWSWYEEDLQPTLIIK
ncbi:hypothetical protein SP069_00185 [Salmonella phage SP069]|uniref:Uncharacterized protein n=2 Tax=Nonanavirus TaxID=1921122 RepID=S4TRJ8_9CAUD|nr:hypothetical protein QII00_sAgp37 [Salmonella phage SP069]AGF89304.1 hypothetical protein SP062_00120 [Salmonella phage FSL SP-062]AGF89536.1 hypothetical protein SP069_00185 [Salmonella phage SP069]ECL8515641.1 hypothetical protein [Salmonella enterica]